MIHEVGPGTGTAVGENAGESPCEDRRSGLQRRIAKDGEWEKTYLPMVIFMNGPFRFRSGRRRCGGTVDDRIFWERRDPLTTTTGLPLAPAC